MLKDSGSGLVYIPDRPYYIFNAESILPQRTSAGDEALAAAEPDYRTVITDANLRRRMGRLLKMSVWCGLKTLEGIDSGNVCGIVTATGMGFMKDTIDMADNMIDRHEDMLNPMPFMQSTFNTASGYIALIRGIRAYNVTYVHREGGFMAALADAMMLVDENPGKGVLVGAFDEKIPAVDKLRRRLGEYRTDDGSYLPLGEGACSMYISGDSVLGDCHAMARIAAVAPAQCGEKALHHCWMPDRDIVTVRCSDHLQETGAFMTMLPAVVCRVLPMIGPAMPAALVIDDVNPAGSMILLCSTE